MQKKEEKCDIKTYKNGIKGALLLIYLALIILIIIWLFKLLKNTKSEPKNRISYIAKDPSNYYEEHEFCYIEYERFLIKGAFDTFDLRIKRIKKYCKAVLATIFIAIGSLIMMVIFFCLSKCDIDLGIGCSGLFFVFALISVILCIAFSIVLAHHYFKSDFNAFEEFSKCRYLTSQFKRDYNFIFTIKDEFKMPFVLILLTEFFNCIGLLFDYEDEDEHKNVETNNNNVRVNQLPPYPFMV